MKRLTKTVSLLAVLVLVLSMLTFLPTVFAGSSSENLLTGGDFEGSTANWWFRTDWGAGNWEVKDGVGKNGSKALAAVSTVDSPTGANNIGVYYTTAGIQAPGALTLEEGATYEIGFDVYRGMGVDSWVYMDDEGGNATRVSASKNGEWESVSGQFRATSDGYNFRLMCNALATGEEVYIDNVYLKKISGKDDKNGLNGTFDTNINGWLGDTSYFAWTDAAGTYKTAAGALSVKEDAARTTRVLYVTVPVEAGKSYTISYWGYKNTTAATYLDVHDGNVDNNQLIQLGIDTSGSWQNPGAVITPTQNEVRIRVVVDNYSSGNFYVDDIVFEEKKEQETLGDNLFKNGDFEATTILNWWYRTDWNGGNWEVTNGIGKDGSKGLSAVSTVADPNGAHNIGVYYTSKGVQAPGALKLEEGETYELGFDVYRGAGVDSRVYMDDEGGNATTVEATANGTWETVSGRFIAKSNDYNFRLVCNALANGEKVYVDNIYLKKVSGEEKIEGVADRSLAVNGSFENGKGSAADGWKQTSVWNRTAKETVTVNGEEITVEPVEGDYMMRATATSTAICMGDPVTVKPHTYYNYSGYMYRTDSQGTAYLNLLDAETLDIPGTQIGTDTTGEWVRVSYTFYSDEHTTIHPRMVIDGTTDAQPTGNPVYFDDIQITELAYTGSKAFPEGVDLTDVKATYALATDSTSAEFAVTANGLYITALAVDDDATQYISKAIASPLTSVINEEVVTWGYESSEIVDITNGKELHAIFKSEDGAYRIEAVWTARKGDGPLEYNQYLTGLTKAISVTYDEVVNANFAIESDGNAKLYRFSRSRVNDGSDPYFASGVLTSDLGDNTTVISGVENGYSPVASILPYQMIAIDGDHGVYFGHYWSFGKLVVRTNDQDDIAITTYLDDNAEKTVDRKVGETFEVPGFFIGTYEGDLDAGSNEMKDWFWEYKMTRSLYKNANEPLIEMGDIGITSELMTKNLFEIWPNLADYVNIIKIDYIWTLPDGTNPRVNKTQEDTWLPDATRYADSSACTGINFGVYQTIKDFAENDGIGKSLYLSLYMADTYLGKDLATQEGREAQLQALKDRFQPSTNDYGIGYDYWRSDFVVEASHDYDSHEGLLYVLDEMIDYSDDFRYEHCSGAGSLKDFTTLERMTFMTTEDTAFPLNHRMSLYANTYMINPVQLKADLNMTYNNRDYGALTGYGPIIGVDEDGKEIDCWTDKEYVTYTLRTSMLGASMVCFNKQGLEMNLDTIKEHYALYNDTHRAILRNCNVYHIMDAPTGWNWADWDGIMYYNDNIDKGTIQLFRENDSVNGTKVPTEKTIVLKGLDADKDYSLTFLDRTEQNCVKSGAELMKEGIKVTGMTERYDSEIIYIQPYNGGESIPVTEVTVTGKNEMIAGEQQTLTATVTPADADNKDVTWTTSSSSIATVDENGVVTAVSEGIVNITATAKDGSGKSGAIAITVSKSGETTPETTPGGETTPDHNDGTTNPKTGDDSNIILWIMLAVVALLAAGAALFFVRRKRS